MSGMVFALVLLGCADDGSACQQLSLQPKRYDSAVVCEADVDFALQSEIALRADYPTVTARCLPIKALSELEKGPIDVRLARLDPAQERGR